MILVGKLMILAGKQKNLSPSMRPSMSNPNAIYDTCAHRCPIRLLFTTLAPSHVQSDCYLIHLRPSTSNATAKPHEFIGFSIIMFKKHIYFPMVFAHDDRKPYEFIWLWEGNISSAYGITIHSICG